MNFCDDSGMSYIEVLVSAAILSVVLIPAVAGFRQASIGYQRSEDIYLAGTNCSNILLRAERSLKYGGPVYGDTLEEFLDSGDFPDAYSLDRFDYEVVVSGINSGGPTEGMLSFYTGTGVSAAVDTEMVGVDFILPENPPLENLIVYDGGFDTSGCPYAEAAGDTCRISVAQPDVSINLDGRKLTSAVSVDLHNDSDGILTLNILSGGNSENLRDLVSITSTGRGPAAIWFRRPETGETRLLTVGVYDKQGRLINRMAKLVLIPLSNENPTGGG